MGKGEIDGFDRMGVLSGSVWGCREKHSAFFGLDQWRLRSTSPILYGVLVGAAENRAHLCVPTCSLIHATMHRHRVGPHRVVSIRRRRDCINSRETTDPPFISITGRKSWPSTLDPADRRVARSTRRARRCRQFRVLPPHAEVRRGQSHAGDVAGNMCWARLSPDRSLSSSATPYRPLIKPRSSQLRSLCSAPWTSFRRYREAIGGFPITYPGFPVTVNRFACSLNRRSSIDSIWFAANGV
ncbi:hypothetical protein GW17_00027441 [Ensete ventricosum]|nr:hypothetical protein GW17_00027441 [Ensete ventricosum]